MKILYLSRAFNVGGLEKNVLLLSRELRKGSHQVLVGASRGTLTKTIEGEGVRFACFNFPFTNIIKMATDVVRLERLVREEHPDIIHVFSATPGVVLWLTKLYYGMRVAFQKKFPPIVASIMGLQTSPDEWYAVTQLRNYCVCFAAQRVYIISPAIGKFVHRLPLKKSRLKDLNVVGIKLPSPVTANPLALKKELGLPPGDRIVMTIGRLEACKSHELFIHAACKVLRRDPDVSFLIVGVGPLKAGLQALVDKNNVSSKVKLVGLRTDVYELLSMCDVYMKPGVVDGFIGITVLEAQAMGVPVAAWYTLDVTMAIENGVTGFLINGMDTNAMAEKIGALLADKRFAEEIGENGRTFVGKTFAIEGIAMDLVKAYELEISG
jgi:glycosyltransferase involved in cell wall biosynthesis